MQPEGVNFNSSSLFNLGSISSKELDPLVKLISTRLGVSEFTAFRVLRKFMGTAGASTFSEINNFMTEFLDNKNQRQVNELAQDLKQLEANPNAKEQNFKPVLSRLLYGLSQAREAQANQAKSDASLKNSFERDRFYAANQAKPQQFNPANKLLQSPRLFASWLVNNKAAFIALKANPKAMNLFLAMQHPVLAKSPVLMSQLTVMIAQLLRLKAGKAPGGEFDEIRRDEFEKEELTAANDHEHHIVNTVKQTVAAQRVGHLRDFLIEAERFAEEEIANLWSLTLKKEKELESKLKSSFKDFKKGKKKE